MQSRSQIDMSDLYCLIERFLSNGPLQNIAKDLREELTSKQIIPRRRDWKGGRHTRTYNELHFNVPTTHLQDICLALGPLLEKHVSPSPFPCNRFLNTGRRYNLLRTVKSVKDSIWRSKQFSASINCRSLCPPFNLISYNRIRPIQSRELGHKVSDALNLPLSLYGNLQLLLRCIGHLSSVYCVLFDRTGSKIFTGSDDCLIKCWCVWSGRLLFTFRGHQAEICDMDISFDNTLLAAASCNRVIRVWDLKTAAPVALLHGHSATLTSLEFSPVIHGDSGYLISTGRDGNVCFWQWNINTKEFCKQPVKFLERSRPGVSMLCASWSSGGRFAVVGGSDSIIHIYFIEPGRDDPWKLTELNFHNDKVDSIRFSHQGLKFASGSCDGTARVWTFCNNAWSSISIDISKNDNSSVSRDDSSVKIKVVMVAWDCFDVYVVTSLTDFSIKVWRYDSGRLVSILHGHTEEAFCLEAHPTDGRILLSAGHDGHIILWDLLSGNPITKFYNSLVGQGHGAIFDAKFSPTGCHVVCTDSHGHLIILGYDNVEKYKKVPDEQFFHTDYRPLIHDSFGAILDEQTQQAPHRMPPPFLVDVDGNPHPAHFQRLVPGRENLASNLLVPIVAVAENGLSEVIDMEGHPTDEENAHFFAPENAHSSSHYSSLEAHEATVTVHTSPPLSQIRNPLIGLRREGEVAGVRQMHSNAPRSQMASAADLMALGHRVLVPVVPKSSAKQNNKYYQTQGEYELQVYRNNQQLANTQTAKTVSLKKLIIPQKTKHSKYVAKQEILMKQESLPSSGEDDESTDGELNCNLTNSRSVLRTNRFVKLRHNYGTRLNILRDSDFDSTVTNESDDEASHKSLSSNENYKSPESGNNSTACGNDDSFNSPMKNLRRNNLKQSVSSNSICSYHYDSDVSESTSSILEEEKKATINNISNGSVSKMAMRASYGAQMRCPFSVIPGVMPPEEYLPPSWITQVIPKPSPYLPQFGDEVVYLKKGHELYIKVIQEKKIWDFGDLSDICYNKLNLSSVETCLIIGMEFEVGPPTLCMLTLKRFKDCDISYEEQTFILRFHDMPDVIDFLVLRKKYEHSIKEHWDVGQRFRSVIDDAWWYGTISELLPKQDDDYFQCFNVTWDSQEKESMSPWDLEVIPESEEKHLDFENNDGQSDVWGLPIDDLEMHELFRSRQLPKEWWGRDLSLVENLPNTYHVVDQEISRIQNGFDFILKCDMFFPFSGPVDLKVYPTYVLAVAYPVDLTIINLRLQNRFYRHLSSLEWDVKQLTLNALAFNREESEIVKTAQYLEEILLTFIRERNCEDMPQLMKRISVNYSFFQNITKKSSSKSQRQNRKRSKRKTNEPSSVIPQQDIPDINIWKRQCSELLSLVWDTEDAAPFRESVDEDVYPDYCDYVDMPMDLKRIREKLAFGSYENPTQMNEDLTLLFRNSKTYNTNKKSKIYSMTVRLQALVCDRMKPIVENWQNTLQITSKMRDLRSDSRNVVRRTRRRVIITPAGNHVEGDKPCTSIANPNQFSSRIKSRSYITSDEEFEGQPRISRKRKRNAAIIDETSDDNELLDKQKRDGCVDEEQIKTLMKSSSKYTYEYDPDFSSTITTKSPSNGSPNDITIKEFQANQKVNNQESGSNLRNFKRRPTFNSKRDSPDNNSDCEVITDNDDNKFTLPVSSPVGIPNNLRRTRSSILKLSRRKRKRKICYAEIHSGKSETDSDESSGQHSRHDSVSSRGRVRRMSTKALESRAIQT